MAQLLKQFKALPAWQKVLIIIGLPLVIVYFAPTFMGLLRQFMEEQTRKGVDKKSNELDKKIGDSKNQAAVVEGKIEQLEEDKKKAVQDAENDDAVSFHNGRGKPTK